MDSFFIISTIRSGSTVIADLCKSAKNCMCNNEESSDIPIITWHVMHDPDYSPKAWVQKVLANRIEAANRYGIIYGDKYPLQFPLIPHLYKYLDCKFVYLTRNGKDVVRSMLNWNKQATGTVYTECLEPEQYSERAKKRNLIVKTGTAIHYSDAVRPRPEMKAKEDVDKWLSLSRIEMYAYYWTYVHQRCLDYFSKIPSEKIFTIDMSDKNRYSRVDEMGKWLGLKDAKSLEDFDKKHNSVEHNNMGTSNAYPPFDEWGEEDKTKFYRFAKPMMEYFGYE